MSTAVSDHTGSVIRLHAGDTVAVARDDLPAGCRVSIDGRELTVRADIPRGHKMALADVPASGPVRKYGQLIGQATAAIAAGDHVHTHNLGVPSPGHNPGSVTHPHGLGSARLEQADASGNEALDATARGPDVLPLEQQATFAGIQRQNGRAATRNYIGVLTSVNCSATVARRIAEHFRGPASLAEYPNVDGVVALTHGSGCGMAGAGEGFDILRRTLTGYARHPNFAALLVLGLGCEVNQIAGLTEGFELPPDVPVVAMTIQELGGTTLTVRAGISRIHELLPTVNDVHRQPMPASKLVLGLNCGGSDAWSGVTANPALGAAVDLLVRNGGCAILGETPEIYGAEHLLTRRASSPEIAERLLQRIRWWEGYTADHGGNMDNNPSPGNKAGGLTTILEKSLGAVAKGGTSALTGVYEYAEPVTGTGLVFMDTPGYDPVSVTGIVAGGANVMCFTTGRGSVLGCKPTPSIKLATNTELYRRMTDDMDLNCGVILDDGVPVEQQGQKVFELVLDVASGRRTKSEELGFGDEEFQPWQLGAVM